MSVAWNCDRRPPRSQCRKPQPWTAFDYATVGILAAGVVATLAGIAWAVLG